MSTEIPWFRELCEAVRDYEGSDVYRDVLVPWVEPAQRALAHCTRFKSAAPHDRKDEAALFALWNLYALSRTNDYLLTGFQPSSKPATSGPTISWTEYEEFFTELGFDVVAPEHFTPFHHEIVRVEQADADDEPIQVLRMLWPGLKFGDLQFSRAGVEVSGGKNYVVKEIAESSTLYFSFRRAYRPTNDLSVGWGSNSQWRTAIRRDYECDGKRIYDFDGPLLLDGSPRAEADRDGLTLAERIELCRNRCFIICAKDHTDLWPFDDRLEELISPGETQAAKSPSCR